MSYIAPRDRPSIPTDLTIEDLVAWKLTYGDLVFAGHTSFLRAIPTMIKGGLINIKMVSINTGSVSVAINLTSDNEIGYPGYKIEMIYKVPIRSAVIDLVTYRHWKKEKLL